VETRSVMIAARALPEEKATLADIARQEQRRPSEVLRELVRQEGRRRGLWPPSGPKGEKAEVRSW
jgi:hypothetical protein